MRSLRRSPAKHNDLLAQDQVFRLQRCSRLEARSQDTENQPEQIGHHDASLRRPLAASTPNRIFGTQRLLCRCRVAADRDVVVGRVDDHQQIALMDDLTYDIRVIAPDLVGVDSEALPKTRSEEKRRSSAVGQIFSEV
jgi:hypothetical protein